MLFLCKSPHSELVYAFSHHHGVTRGGRLLFMIAIYLLFNARMHNTKLIAEATIHAIFNGIDATKNDTTKSMTIAAVIKYADAFLARRKINPNNIVIKANNITITTAERSTNAISQYLTSYANANE